LEFGGRVIRVESSGQGLRPGEEAVLNIRPEAIQITSMAPTGVSSNVLEGMVRTHTFVGQWVRYWVDVTLRPEAAPYEFVVDVPDPRERGILEGRVFLGLDPRKIHHLQGV
jgi:hypothetical protein